LDSAVDRFGGWVQYGDTKAGAVLVVLGLGLTDLLDNARTLIRAHQLPSGWGTLATVCFAIAIAAAATAVITLGATVFPRAPRSKPANWTLLYYRDVAARGAATYASDVTTATLATLNDHRAREAYGLAKIAQTKAVITRYAYLSAGLFLLSWPAARIAFTLAT